MADKSAAPKESNEAIRKRLYAQIRKTVTTAEVKQKRKAMLPSRNASFAQRSLVLATREIDTKNPKYPIARFATVVFGQPYNKADLSPETAEKNGAHFDDDTGAFVFRIAPPKKKQGEAATATYTPVIMRSGVKVDDDATAQQQARNSVLAASAAAAKIDDPATTGTATRMVFAYQPVSVLVGGEMQQLYGGNAMGVCDSLSCTLREGRRSLSCEGISEVERLPSDVLYNMLCAMPTYTRFVPNPRTDPSYADATFFLIIDPIAALTAGPADEESELHEPINALHRVTFDVPPVPQNNVREPPWMVLKVMCQSLQWMADCRPETLLVDATVWKEDLISMFGVANERLWLDVVSQYAQLTSMILACSVDDKDTANSPYNNGEVKSDAAGCILARVQSVTHRARWIIENALIPVTREYVEANKALIWPTTPVTGKAATYLQQTPYYTPGKETFALCLSSLPQMQFKQTYASMVDQGKGVLRVMSKPPINIDDVVTGRYVRMTPQEGVELLSKICPAGRGDWPLVLYFVKVRSPEKQAVRQDRLEHTIRNACERLGLDFDVVMHKSPPTAQANPVDAPKKPTATATTTTSSTTAPSKDGEGAASTRASTTRSRSAKEPPSPKRPKVDH